VARFIFLVGLSGSGKSTVGRMVAERLSLPFYDLDVEVEKLAGRPISEIFAGDGEVVFRDLEGRMLQEILKRKPGVVATGGGVVTRPANLEAMGSHGWIVHLEVRPEVAADRLMAEHRQRGKAAYRPLVGTEDPISRIRALHSARAHLYREAAHWTVQTDYVSPWAVASAVVEGVKALESRGLEPQRHADLLEFRSPLGERGQSILVGKEMLSRLGELVHEHMEAGRAFIVTDATVGGHWLEPAMKALDNCAPDVFVVEPGETSKQLAVAHRCYDWLAEQRAERGDCIVALGGGVVGDLAGYVASTYMRGMRLVQVPTTLLAMVDAAIGGKTGVNHPRAKNLIGTIYHAGLIVADVATLSTLPSREFRAGMAEVIKYRAIATEVLGYTPSSLARLPELMESSLSLPALCNLVAECIRIKLEVVVRDEREAGLRRLLNYGHTIGHAIEAATNYRLLLHGEAVAVGMHAAAAVAQCLGLVDEAYCNRQAELIRKAGLPLVARADPQRVMEALALDKKVRSGSVQWVLPASDGRMLVGVEVPPDVVWQALQSVTASSR
jgi:shikimate kinase/3-dehydroquinate synthase